VKWLLMIVILTLVLPTTTPLSPLGADVADSFARRPVDSTSPRSALTRAVSGAFYSSLIPIGADLSDVAIDPERPLAYIADRTNARVFVVDLVNSSVLQTVSVGREPITLAIGYNSTSVRPVLYVGHAGERSIIVLNLDDFTIERVFTTSFFVRSLVTWWERLIATVHDPSGSGDFPYLLNGTDGGVLQRLDSGLSLTEFDYRDAIGAINFDISRFYLMNTGSQAVAIQLFFHFGDAAWSSTGRDPTPGSLGADGRDLLPYCCPGPLLIARGTGPVVAIDGNMAPGIPTTYGELPASTTVAMTLWGDRLATSRGDGTIDTFEYVGTHIATTPVSGAVERLRLTPSARQFVVIVGTGSNQNVELVDTTQVVPLTPTRASREQRPEVTARVLSLVGSLSAGLDLDGQPIPADWRASEGVVTATPGAALAEGPHTVRVRVYDGAAFIASAEWTFVVDTIPPILSLDQTPPSTLEAPEVTVTGTVRDANSVILTLGGQPVTTDSGGNFTLTLTLRPGTNDFVLMALDDAGWGSTLAFRVLNPALGDWFVHPVGHFQMRPPLGWSVQRDVPVGQGTALLSATGPDATSTLTVVSERRSLEGSATQASAIVQEALDELASAPGFFIMQPTQDRTIDGHFAARVLFRVQLGSVEVQQILVVVVGPEYGTFWALVATFVAGELEGMGSWMEASILSFDVTPSSNVDGFGTAALLLGAGAAGAGGAVYLVLRRRRRAAAAKPAPIVEEPRTPL